MKSAIAHFADDTTKAGPEAIAIIYYAGHGVQIEGTNYLVPVDASASSASDVVIGAVSASDLLRTLELAHAKVNVLVLDACRDNPFKGATRSLTRGLAKVDAPAGSIVAYSTAPGQVAQDGSTANSPYAEALAKHIATPGLVLEEVFRKVRIDVSQLTNGAQVPWEETSLTQEVTLADEGTTTQVVAATPEVIPALDPAIDANRAFMLAVATNTIESYDDFLRKHPGAKDVQQAMHNLTMLSDEKHWREATAQNSLGAYKIYLNLHRDGSYASEARQMISDLSAKSSGTGKDTVRIDGSEEIAMNQSSGYDVLGTDMRTLKNIDFDSCSTACSNEESCVAAAYRSDLKRCYMKSTADLLIQNSKVDLVIRARIQPAVPVSAFEMLPQTDIPGNDLNGSSVKLNFAQDCLRLCENTSGCNAFSYVTANKACWLKASVRDRVPNPPVVSGMRVR
jgi:Caspase domain/PAN domain